MAIEDLCIFYNRTFLDWRGARQFCQSKDADLLSVHDQQAYSALAPFIQGDNKKSFIFHLDIETTVLSSRCSLDRSEQCVWQPKGHLMKEEVRDNGMLMNAMPGNLPCVKDQKKASNWLARRPDLMPMVVRTDG